MAKNKSRDDETFGRLTHIAGDLWERPLELLFMGKTWTARLMVDIDPRAGIEQNQILAYNMFNQNTSGVIASAEEAIYSYYRRIGHEYRARYGIVGPDDARVPIIGSISEVFTLVAAEGVTFPYARHVPTFGILCSCTWEEEHGLAIKYEDGRLVEVGFQDIVL